MRTVLIIGATGIFGRRLSLHLAGFDGIKLVLTSRDKRKAEALCMEIKRVFPHAVAEALAFEKSRGFGAISHALNPFVVIDASGPFQFCDLSFPKAVIAAGAHYLDLADAHEYLLAFSELDAEAKAAGVVALAGASSTPALSSAAVETLTKNWCQIDSLKMAIAPGGQSEVGLAVLQAILSYAGTKIEIFSDGQLEKISAWTGSKTIQIPGLGKRRVAPVETADAALLSKHFKVRSSIIFQAGLESPIEQWGMVLIARLRQIGLLPRLQWLAPFLLKTRKLTQPFTGDRGGMLVEAIGLDEAAKPICAQWSLLAEKGDGPHVPTLPAAAALRALLANALETGARPCVCVLSLEAIEREMKPYAITTCIIKTDRSP